MSATHSLRAEDNTFFQLLQQQTDLDLRDKRGQRHSMPLVLMGVLMAILAGRDGSLSSIHRYIVNQFDWLSAHFQPCAQHPISRAQLPRLLAFVNTQRFVSLVVKVYGLSLSAKEHNWLAADGKELRGSIASGCTRGMSCVSVVEQQSQLPVAQSYYDGRKQSERPAIINLLTDNHLLSCKITLDALHLTPDLVTAIARQQGCYLIGLKSNQHRLLRSCIVRTMLSTAEFVRLDSVQHKHGRHQRREYRYYSLEGLALDKRWHKAGLRTLVEVKRTHFDALGKPMSETQSYYVSNAPVSCQTQANDLYEAIRGHWNVEVMHYRRDVILKEDAFRCLKKSVQQVMATVRTMALSLLSGQNMSMNALIDLFRDKIKELFQFLSIKKVL